MPERVLPACVATRGCQEKVDRHTRRTAPVRAMKRKWQVTEIGSLTRTGADKFQLVRPSRQV